MQEFDRLNGIVDAAGLIVHETLCRDKHVNVASELSPDNALDVPTAGKRTQADIPGQRGAGPHPSPEALPRRAAARSRGYRPLLAWCDQASPGAELPTMLKHDVLSGDNAKTRG
jgi:hypothetical protein